MQDERSHACRRDHAERLERTGGPLPFSSAHLPSTRPGEHRAHGVVPYRPDDGTGQAGKPPWLIGVVDERGDTNVRQRAEATDEIKREQAPDEPTTSQPLIPICEHV